MQTTRDRQSRRQVAQVLIVEPNGPLSDLHELRLKCREQALASELPEGDNFHRGHHLVLQPCPQVSGQPRTLSDLPCRTRRAKCCSKGYLAQRAQNNHRAALEFVAVFHQPAQRMPHLCRLRAQLSRLTRAQQTVVPVCRRSRVPSMESPMQAAPHRCLECTDGKSEYIAQPCARRGLVGDRA